MTGNVWVRNTWAAVIIMATPRFEYAVGGFRFCAIVSVGTAIDFGHVTSEP